ncbi:arylmalonate decarboxylase [Cucumibacter marinus]|uniref:arylmalonate decarboxylase n=1 Tax=Cucumibacter marinus TaxID=1121252 RepID=UPI00041173F5|nr:hypothetical protein [Cucumibacter marinus]
MQDFNKNTTVQGPSEVPDADPQRPIGLIVPPAQGLVPPDANIVYPGVNFVARGLGLTEMSLKGYDTVIGKVGDAAEALAADGAIAISLMGTSLSFYRGDEFNERLLEEIETRSALPATTMSSSITLACHTMGARHIAVATAYDEVVSARLCSFLKASGLEVVSVANLGIVSIDEVHSVAEADVLNIGRDAVRNAGDADALLISCGGLSTRAAVEVLEGETDLPVVTSPLAGLWGVVAKAGRDPRVEGHGRLFRRSPKA